MAIIPVSSALPPPQSTSRRAVLAGAAGALMLGSRPALATLIAPDDPRLRTITQGWRVHDGAMMVGYLALPRRARGRQPAVILVHDADGLTEDVRDLARRIALEGSIVVAPDFLTPGKGTPADAAEARTAIATLDPTRTLYDAQLTLHWLRYHRYVTGKVAAVGLGWGGALVDRLAAVSGDRPAACVIRDAPSPPSAVTTPTLRLDMPNDDTAWDRTTAFLKEHLA